MTTSTKPALTLEAVAEHFAQWRHHKKKGERIPEALWYEAIALLDHYRISQVVRTLRLSGSDLNKRRRRFAAPQPGDAQAEQAHTFAEMVVPVSQHEAERTATTWLEFQRPDGVCLRVHAAEGAELRAWVDRFIGSASC